MNLPEEPPAPAVALPPDAAAPGPAADRAYALKWWLLVWVPLLALLVLGLGRVALGPEVFHGEAHLMTLCSLWLYLALLAWLWTSARHSGLDWAATFGPRPRASWLPEVGLVAWLHLQLNGALFLLLLAALHSLWPEWSRGLGEAGAKSLSFGRSPAWIQWAIIVVLAPLTEEWLFRGVLFHRFARRMGARRAQLLTSFLFAILHMNPFGVFALGMMLQALYRRTRSLTTCVLAHALNNAVPLTLMLWNRGPAPTPAVQTAELDRVAHAWLAWLLMSVAFTALLVWHLRGRWPAVGERTPWESAGMARAGSAEIVSMN